MEKIEVKRKNCTNLYANCSWCVHEDECTPDYEHPHSQEYYDKLYKYSFIVDLTCSFIAVAFIFIIIYFSFKF